MSGSRTVPAPQWTDPLADNDVLLRLANGVLAAYLALTAPFLFRWALGSNSWLPLVCHLGALAAACVLATSTPRVPGAVRDWFPLALGPFLYVELRWIIAGAGRAHSDAVIIQWERALFPSDPSRSLSGTWPWVSVSETLHLCYLSYYALVYVPPILLWVRGRRSGFGATVLALVVVYAACFVTYIGFPVDGPRYLIGAASAPAGPLRDVVRALLESGSSRGTAFPSSHVAAAVVAALSAIRFQRGIGIIVAGLTAGLALGAVYGGYHYAIDVVVGAAVGVLAAAVARRIESGIAFRVHTLAHTRQR